MAASGPERALHRDRDRRRGCRGRPRRPGRARRSIGEGAHRDRLLRPRRGRQHRRRQRPANRPPTGADRRRAAAGRLRRSPGPARTGADRGRRHRRALGTRPGAGLDRGPAAPARTERFDALPTGVAAGRLLARWDSDAYPPGSYEFRATGYDAAGNAAASRPTRRRVRRWCSPNPLKARPRSSPASAAGGSSGSAAARRRRAALPARGDRSVRAAARDRGRSPTAAALASAAA